MILRCVDCGSTLSGAGEELECSSCGRRFPVVAGIADLRGPLEGFDVEADRHLALSLEAARASAGLEDLLRRYWAAQPGIDPRLVDRFVKGDLIGADRAAAVAGQIEELLGPGSLDVDLALEVGCGTAALGSVLAKRARQVVVSDVALSWLVLARHRLAEGGIDNATVVAAAVDHLPLASASVDLVVGADVVEHVPDAAAMVRSCCRVLRPGGHLWLSTPNRFSLTPEPHVRLWGVGFLPRRAGVAYVRRARHTDYSDVHTLSHRGLRRTLALSGGAVQVTAPAIVAPQRARYGRPAQAVIRAYDRARGAPLLSGAVARIGPLFHGVTRVPSTLPPARGAGGRSSVPYFQQVAADYEARYSANDVGGHALRARRDRVRELVGGAGVRVLDVGCGSGPMAPDLSHPGGRFVGVDASVGMVAEAARLRDDLPNVHFAAADAEVLPFVDGYFDVVICIGVLERVPDRDRAVDDMARVTRPGGVVLVTFPNLVSPYATWRGFVWYPAVATLKRLVAAVTDRPAGPLLLSPVRHWTRRSATALLTARVGPVDAVVPYYFNVMPSPLDELFPNVALRLARRAEGLRRSPLWWLGAGFIVRATRR